MTQEKGFKLVTRWYRFSADHPSLQSFLTRLLLVLSCSQMYYASHLVGVPPVKRFWQQIIELYCKLIATSIQPSPEVVLLSMLPGSFKSVKRDIIVPLPG